MKDSPASFSTDEPPDDDRFSQMRLSPQVGVINQLPVPSQNPDDAGWLLSSPETLPLRDLSAILHGRGSANDRQRVVIVAPHPDDETLGCGGAIALLCDKGYRVKVLVISDGTGSHPTSQKYPAPLLQSIRSQETIAALGILGVEPSAISFLQLKDGAVPTVTSPTFHQAKVSCRNYLQATLPDTIFLPWRCDPHADRRASWQLIQAAVLSLGITPQMIEYPIWDWDVKQQKAGSKICHYDGGFTTRSLSVRL
jgi:LmbE family N-acetylglucosaminyl deacetylase